MTKRVVIIGAGPGGLASAMLLRNAGLDVTVLERLDRVGGRCSTLRSQRLGGPAGYRFDMGPTFFLYPAILEEIFAACGHDLHREVEMTRLDPQYRLIFEGGAWGERAQIDATPDVARMSEQLARISPRDAPHMQRFITENRAKFEAFKPILQREWSGLGDLMSLDMMKMLPMVRPWASVDRDLRRYFSDERIRLAFSFQSKYLGMSPFNCPSLFTILSYLEYDYGVWHPTGGCGAVCEAMARVARSMGVRFRLADEVRRVLIENGRAVGVVSDSGEHRADALVINADFADAMTRLVPDHHRRAWRDKKLSKKRYSCSTFMLYLGLEGRDDDLPHHTIFLAGDYPDNLRDIEKRHRLSHNPSMYVQNASVTDPTLAPVGHSTLYVLAPVSHDHPNIDWDAQRQSFRRTVLDQLPKLGIAGVEDRIRFEQVYTPNDWRDGMHVYRGATFNLAHSLTQMLHLRPRNRFDEIPGTYLVGGGTHPGSGLPVIYESARISSRLLLEDLGVNAGASPHRYRSVRDAGPRLAPVLDRAAARVG